MEKVGKFLVFGFLLLFFVIFASETMAGIWVQTSSSDFSSQSTMTNVQVDGIGDTASVVLASLEGQNLALGRLCTDKDGKSVPLTDGSISSSGSDWKSFRTSVKGFFFTVDLGDDKAVNRVVVKGSEYLQTKPEFYAKGYIIEVSTSDKPTEWAKVAENPSNANKDIDTASQATWLNTDEQGNPVPAIGRYVKFSITNEDGTNWVTLGDIEVYGVGYPTQGIFESRRYRLSSSANFGAARWVASERVAVAGATPGVTSLKMQFRTARNNANWADWADLSDYDNADTTIYEPGIGVIFSALEPANYIQYRAMMSTTDPRVSPALESVEIDFDTKLVVTEASASVSVDKESIAPDTIYSIGNDADFIYDLDLTLESNNQGVDQVALLAVGEVKEVLWISDGGAPQGLDYEIQASEDPKRPYLESPKRPKMIIRSSSGGVLVGAPSSGTLNGTLRIVFSTAFFFDTNIVRSRLSNVSSLTEDNKYLNVQDASPASADSWIVFASGIPDEPLPADKVRVTPNPFNPLNGNTRISFDVAKVGLGVERPVSIRIFSLTGRRIKTGVLDVRGSEFGERTPTGAGRHEVFWNGKDDDGNLVPPGPYILQIELHTDVHGLSNEVIVVAY